MLGSFVGAVPLSRVVEAGFETAALVFVVLLCTAQRGGAMVHVWYGVLWCGCVCMRCLMLLRSGEVCSALELVMLHKYCVWWGIVQTPSGLRESWLKRVAGTTGLGVLSCRMLACVDGGV